jgi:hypothetical protein
MPWRIKLWQTTSWRMMSWRIGMAVFLLAAVRPLPGAPRLPNLSPDRQTTPDTTHPRGIFDDLPVEDPSLRSGLLPHENPGKKVRDNIHLILSVDRRSCYAGEQVKLTCKLYTALQSNSTVVEKPSLDDFISNEEPPAEGEEQDKVEGGKSYHVFTIWQVILTANKPGDDTLDPVSVDNEISYKQGDGKLAHYSAIISSNRVPFRILPLPAAGQPPGFSGPVGIWQLHTRLQADRLTAGENDTLWLELAGRGSFNNLAVPDLSWPPGFQHYESVEKWYLQPHAYPQSGKKLIGIPFTDTVTGNYWLPAVTFSYFDPVAHAYKVARSDSVPITIVARERPTTGTRPSGTDHQAPALFSWPLASMCLLGIGLVTAGVLLVRRTRHRPLPAPSDPAVTAVAPSPPAPDFAAELDRVLAISDEASFLAGISGLLIDCLQSRLDMETGKAEELLPLLATKDARLAAKMQLVLEECNHLLYSPHLPDSGIRATLGVQAAEICRAVQDQTTRII